MREELCLHSDERPVVGEPTTGFTSHPQPVTGLPGCSVKNQEKKEKRREFYESI